MPSFSICLAVGFLSPAFFLSRSSISCSMKVTRSALDFTASKARSWLKRSRLVIFLVVVEVAIVSIPFWFLRLSLSLMQLLYHRRNNLSIGFANFFQGRLRGLLLYILFIPTFIYNLKSSHFTKSLVFKAVGEHQKSFCFYLSHLMYSLYHRSSGLSRGFSNFF